MRKKVLFLGIAAALVAGSLPFDAFAAVKAGSNCSKAGTRSTNGGKIYTCVKSGKKLVWDKGVVVPVAKPVPSASASASASTSAAATPLKSTFTPWAIKFVTADMTNMALQNTSDYLGKVTPTSSYQLSVDPSIKESDKTWISGALSYVNGAFNNVLQGQVKVFLGTTHEWSATTLKKANMWVGDPQSPYPCSNGVNDAYCADPNVVLLVYSDIYRTNSNYRWDVGRKSTPAHEMFHNVQFAIGGRNLAPDDPAHIPRWLMEGSANYFGFYIVEKLDLGSYSEGRQNQVTSNPAYRETKPLSGYDNFNSDPYGIGQAASEYLIASIGFENFLNIWKYTKSENSFAAGFKKASGIDIADFYAKFEAARSSMKIGSSN